MTIKAIIFDVGGVLMRTENPGPRAALEARLGLQAGDSDLLVFNGSSGQAAQLGQISSALLWQGIANELALNETEIKQFRQEFFGGDFLNRPLLQLVRHLRLRYQTAILSNFMDDLRRMLREEYPMTDAFDQIIISAEEGIMKPDPALFERTLERLGRQPHEAVFIDDFQHNVVGAQQVGMHAIHYTPAVDVAQELATFGVQVAGS